MNLKEIRAVIDLMNDNDLIEVEIEREGSKVKLKKASGAMMVPAPMVAPVVAAAPISAVSQEVSPAVNSNRQEVKSPMVGTFYVSPSPESDPFVKVGDVIAEGQVIGIIEAMKLMNEIKSEVKGRIVEQATDNAQPVEFGQALFYVEPV